MASVSVSYTHLTDIKGGENLFPFWVKNTGQHRLGVKNILSHLADHNIDVVILGHGQNGVATLNAGALEHILVDGYTCLLYTSRCV